LYAQFSMTFTPVSGAELEARHSAAMAEARKMFANRRILVVDDDAAIRAATRHKLMELCCAVREAADGVDAMRELQESVFDAVLVDLNMPRMSGYELAENLRSGRVPANREVCLVAYTSEPPHIARAKTENAGFDGFVPKRCDQATLVRSLCTAMESRTRSRGPAKDWLAGRRFLIADDNAYNRAALGGYLRHAGGEVVEAGNGEAVLRELAAGARFDAALLDLHMPGMGGVDTARALRAAETGDHHVPLLAITAHADAAMMAEGREAGIADFIIKPVDSALLYEKLGSLLGVPLPHRTVAAAPVVPMPAEKDGLLDVARLEGYERIGMLDELVDEFAPEIEALVTRLRAAVARQDMEGALETLHSLVGMSGEAGTQTLYRYCRGIYVPMLEKQAWPATPGWDEGVRTLAGESTEALRAWAAARARSRA
jgi:CheY-like chemotaxis protein